MERDTAQLTENSVTNVPCRRRRTSLAVVMIVLCAPGPSAVASDSADATESATLTRELSSKYDDYNVTLTPLESELVQALEFDSPILRKRVRSTVYLPERYRMKGRAVPVSYFLHGATDGTGQERDTPNGAVNTAGSGYLQTELFDFDTTLDRHRYVVVALDTHPASSWCTYCAWIDGRNGKGVAAESHLHQELIPLIETLFNVQTDRSGRGIFGYSMGGWGSVTQAFRHPDRFVFAGAVSPMLDMQYDPVFNLFTTGVGFMRQQGYGTGSAVEEIHYRNVNPVDLVPQAVNAGIDVTIASGDGCIGRTDGTCGDESLDAGEALSRENSDAATAAFDLAGLAYHYHRLEGVHGGQVQGVVYRQFFIDALNDAFSRSRDQQSTFSYKTVDKSFSVWGYQVRVERPNEEFLHLLGARKDGRRFILAGTGRVLLTTPARFLPNRAYTLKVTRDHDASSDVPRSSEERVVMASDDGRVAVDIPLGTSRSVDERRTLVDRGLFRHPHTLVEIDRFRN